MNKPSPKPGTVPAGPSTPLPPASPPHLSSLELNSKFHSLPPQPKDAGFLTLIVVRPVVDTRVLLESVLLSDQEGLPGDRWGLGTPRNYEAQIAVMRRDVAELIANGQPIGLFGDNLFVDLDLSATNLPAGTRLQVGGASVEVTPLPHNGCGKFSARFGRDALQFVNAIPTRQLNLRGIYWKVVESGLVRVGSPIRVLSSVVSHKSLD